MVYEVGRRDRIAVPQRPSPNARRDGQGFSIEYETIQIESACEQSSRQASSVRAEFGVENVSGVHVHRGARVPDELFSFAGRQIAEPHAYRWRRERIEQEVPTVREEIRTVMIPILLRSTRDRHRFSARCGDAVQNPARTRSNRTEAKGSVAARVDDHDIETREIAIRRTHAGSVLDGECCYRCVGNQGTGDLCVQQQVAEDPPVLLPGRHGANGGRLEPRGYDGLGLFHRQWFFERPRVRTNAKKRPDGEPWQTHWGR